MARIRNWRGKEVAEAVAKNIALALGEFGLEVEGNAKRELARGHGVLTGTLRRSIHTAQTGYNWSGDDTEPSSGSPERGGKKIEAVVNGRRISIQVGSGLIYALPVHQGHQSFEGYHYLTNGLDKAKSQLPRILKKYQLK